MNVALVDLGSLMLRAGRRPSVLPNMALLLRFPEPLDLTELEDEARRFASSPYALGRRLTPARVPGARPRWVPSPEPPPVVLAPPRRTPRELGMWLSDELSVNHDPERAAGWRMAATTDPDGAMVVAVTVNHLFGTGRDIATTVYGGQGMDSVNGSDGDSASASRVVWEQLGDSADRLRRGATGMLRLTRDVALLPVRREAHGELADLRKPWAALRDRDPSRGRASARRVGAAVRIEQEEWTDAVRRHEASNTALQIAICANVLREARTLRGAAPDRPLRLIVPVDLADRSAVPSAAATVGPIQLTSATVILPGGRPRHGALAEVRDRLRQAVGRALDEVKVTGRVPVAPGVIDAMRLLPDALTSRVLFGVHAHYDGAVSNVGPLPPGMLRMGEHTASDAFMMAYPLGSDAAFGFATHGGAVALGSVADPSRLGAGPPLRERIVAELDRWGISACAW